MTVEMLPVDESNDVLFSSATAAEKDNVLFLLEFRVSIVLPSCGLPRVPQSSPRYLVKPSFWLQPLGGNVRTPTNDQKLL